MVEGRVDISPVKPRKKYPNYRTYRECKYSPSCFECPLEDCKVALTVAVYRNALPEDRYRSIRMGRQAHLKDAIVTAISAPWLRRCDSFYG